MTAEVAILNRSAVALAADSATTITYWENGRSHVRFFKGANKIFNISDRYPVGLMIFDAGSLFGMPWETIAKAYRDRRGGNRHDELTGYVHEFADFITTDEWLFPRAYQEAQLISHLVDVVLRVCRVSNPDETERKDQPQPKIEALVREKFESLDALVRKTSYLKDCDGHAAKIEKEAQPFKDRVREAVADNALFKTVTETIEWDAIFDLAVTALFRTQWTTLPTSGLVFAGFGEKQYFPHIHHFTCYGIILGKLLCSRVDENDVSTSHDNISQIIPLAQSEMVNTFIAGASDGALTEIDKNVMTALTDYTTKLREAGFLDDTDNNVKSALTEMRDQSQVAFANATAGYLARVHTVPLRNVVGMLSIDELGSLAETLISIESLKERVTRPTESVSGPIDVAVISKSDGFIWIKRKHYFDAKLNPSYVARRNLRLGEPNDREEVPDREGARS